MRLLVVEDDADIAALIARDLHVAGYTIDTVGIAEGGFNAALDIGYSAIVVDLRLPDGDGLDLVRRLRARGRSRSVGRRGRNDVSLTQVSNGRAGSSYRV